MPEKRTSCSSVLKRAQRRRRFSDTPVLSLRHAHAQPLPLGEFRNSPTGQWEAHRHSASGCLPQSGLLASPGPSSGHSVSAVPSEQPFYVLSSDSTGGVNSASVFPSRRHLTHVLPACCHPEALRWEMNSCGSTSILAPGWPLHPQHSMLQPREAKRHSAPTGGPRTCILNTSHGGQREWTSIMPEVEVGCLQQPVEMASWTMCNTKRVRENSDGLTRSTNLIFQTLGVGNIHEFLGDNIQVRHTSMCEIY